jgi:prepilin-type N-terminal cleavage/methylation domain-containing protein
MRLVSRDTWGFTLLELVLVLLIIGMALAVTYPSLSRGTAAFHLRATGRDILNTLRFAREKAITEQVYMLVVADREKQTVQLSDALGGGLRSYPLPDDVRIIRLLLGGIELPEGPLMIRFMTNGSCEAAEIVLQSRSGSVLRVVTDPLGGGARVAAEGAEERQ